MHRLFQHICLSKIELTDLMIELQDCLMAVRVRNKEEGDNDDDEDEVIEEEVNDEEDESEQNEENVKNAEKIYASKN